MDGGPDSLALADHARLLARERGLDEHGDLDRVRVREPGGGELVRGRAEDGRGVDEVGADVSRRVRVEDEQVDAVVQRGGRDRLGLGDVEVVEDGLGAGGEGTAGVVHDDGGPGLRRIADVRQSCGGLRMR